MESLISPIVESIETFLNAEREEGGGRRGNGKLQAADRRPLSGRARLGIREAVGRGGFKQGGHGVDEGEDDESRFDKGRLIGVEIMN